MKLSQKDIRELKESDRRQVEFLTLFVVASVFVAVVLKGIL